MEYNNPTKQFVVDDWPYGRELKTQATFAVQSNKSGERVVRTTINPNTGQLMKPKYTTYSKYQRIVTGEDKKTYILGVSHYGGMITVMQGNMKYQEEVIHESSEPERYTLYYDMALGEPTNENG